MKRRGRDEGSEHVYSWPNVKRNLFEDLKNQFWGKLRSLLSIKLFIRDALRTSLFSLNRWLWAPQIYVLNIRFNKTMKAVRITHDGNTANNWNMALSSRVWAKFEQSSEKKRSQYVVDRVILSSAKFRNTTFTLPLLDLHIQSTGHRSSTEYLCREIYGIYPPIRQVRLPNTIDFTARLSALSSFHSDGRALDALDCWPGTDGSTDWWRAEITTSKNSISTVCLHPVLQVPDISPHTPLPGLSASSPSLDIRSA